MRVVMLGPFGLKPKGTMAVRALPLAKALNRRGHQVTLILPPWSYPQDAGRIWDESGVRVENVKISPRAAIPVRMIQRAQAFHPDAIHIFKPKAYAGIAQWLVWQRRRVGMGNPRLVLDTDDWEGAGGWNDLEPYSFAHKKFFGWQEKWGLRHADAVTVASRALETIAWSLGVPRAVIRYLPNGVNPLPASPETRASIRKQLGLENARVILLYTRFFEYDVARLCEILLRVLTQLPDVRVLLVGKGLFGEEERFFKIAHAQGWRERVVDAGWVGVENLSAHFCAADAALFPFDDTLVNRCKCSVKLIDLLANGVPVVAEAVGQVREYIRHNETGILVTPGDVDEFVNSLIDLLSDGEKRARLGKCAQEEMASKYAWEKLAVDAEMAYSTSP